MAFDISSCSNITVAIDHSKVDSALTNFPVAIDLDDECSALVTALGSNSLKMAVYSGSTELSVEIECWEAGNHVIHTKVPSVSASADTELKLYYDVSQSDNSDYVGVTGSTPAQNVWDDDFVAVYHMAQDPSGTAPQLLDSTGNNHDGTSYGSMTSGDLLDGDLGKRIDFDGSGDYFDIGTVALSIPYSLECDATIDSYSSFILGGDDAYFAPYASELILKDDGNHLSRAPYTFSAGRYYLGASVDSTLGSLYVDGELLAGSDQISSNVTIKRIGYYSSGNDLDGKMSELRLSSTNRSAAWVSSTNYNLKKELVSYSSASSSTHAPLVVDSGTVKELASTDIVKSAITDTNDKFTAETMDEAFDELGETKNWNGFDLQDTDSMGTLTWDNSTKKISLAVKSGETSFHFWVDGKKQTSTATITSDALPATSGTYYFYLDTAGAMQYILEASVSLDMFYKYAIVALVYWNETASYGMPYEERHGYRMSSADHEMEHMTIGARYASGLAITGLTDGASTFTGYNSGKYYDEDIPHSIATATTAPFLYRLGADAEWTWSTADNNVGFKNSGTYATWNKDTAGTWSLEQADSSHDYILIFHVAQKTLSGYPDFAKIIDQAGYSTRGNARDAIEGAKKQLILDGLPSPEMCFIGVHICRKTAVLEDLADGSVYLDLRGSSSRGSGGDSATTNLAADSVVDASGFSGNLSTTDTDVQTALGTLDTLDIVNLVERSADPSDPAEGKAIIWQSDGTGTGDDGDVLIKVTAGGTTKTGTLFDFSA